MQPPALAVVCRWSWLLAVLVGALTPAASATALGKPHLAQVRSAAGVDRLRVHFRGNRVLLDSVLLWILDLPTHGPATARMAQHAEDRLRSFFQQTGYELARVRAHVDEGELYVFVDEGRLDKVFFTGVSATQALRLQLDLRLPGNVYNRQRVSKEIGRLQRKYNLKAMRAQLIVREPRPAAVIQLGDFIDALHDDSVDKVWRESRGRYELRIHVDSDDWKGAVGYGVNYLLPYGLEPYVGFASGGLLLAGDRYRLSLAASGLRDKLFTQAKSQLYWAAPALESGWLRPSVSLRARLDSFERPSLGLESYDELRLNAAASAGIEPTNGLTLALGVGYGYENLFDLKTTVLTPDYVRSGTRHYPLLRLQLRWLTHMGGLRPDKFDRLAIEFEAFEVAQGMVRRGEITYRHVWQFGYQDLFWRVRAASVGGPGARWQDEEPIASTILRAVAGDEDFARTMGQMGLEFRLSLYRDILKVSAAGGAAVVGLVERSDQKPYPNFFACIGPGIHVLLLDNFEADAYYSFGWRQGVAVEGAFSLALAKVF